MNKHQPLVSVVIPTHNRKVSLLRLIDSVLKNNLQQIEIIVIDDASTDGTFESVSNKYNNHPEISILRNKKNLHVAASRNVGAKKAKGKYIFFIDDDNVATPDLLKSLVTVMETDESIGEVGPVMYFFSNKKHLYWAGTKRDMTTSRTLFTTSLAGKENQEIWDTDDVLNAFLVRRDVVSKNEIFFKEKLGIMYEESDYAYRIRKAGYSVKVVKNAVIYHDTDDFSRESNKTAFLYHTMANKKRAYFTARNRLVFHRLYSPLQQFLVILLFWNWLFAGFYLYHILIYDGPGTFTPRDRLLLISSYLKGILDGFIFAVNKKL